MEWFWTLGSICLLYMFATITRWAIQRSRRLKIFKQYKIPGPEPSFLGGNMAAFYGAPTPNHVITDWTKTYGNVFGFYLGEIPHVIINDLDMIKQVFIKDFHNFSNRPEMFLDVSPLNKTVIALRGKRWKEVRSILTPTFSSGKIKLMTSIVDKKVDITVKVVAGHAEKGEMFDMYELVQGLTLDVIADCALAMKTQCQQNPKDIFLIAVRDFFRYAHNRAVELAIMFPFVAYILAFISNHMTAGQMTSLIVQNVQEVIASRRAATDVRSVDILQLMLDSTEKDSEGKSLGMTDEEIVANAYVFLLAGYETTATALAFTFYLLIKNPDIQEKLYEEIANADDASYNTVQGLQYLDQIFSESLRYYPPVTGFVSRHCDSDHQVGDFMIPKGAIVQAPVWDIHHNPEIWPDPWKFDPDRFDPANKGSIHGSAYMPFGLGRRNCVGARFAQLEAKLAIYRLIKRFRFDVCEKTEDPLTLICPTVIINPANGIYLRAVERSSSVCV